MLQIQCHKQKLTLGFQILAFVMKSEKNWTKIVIEDLSSLGGDMMARLRPDVEFRVEEDKTGKVTRFFAHRKVVGALLGPADTEKVVKVKDVAGEAFRALLTFLYQPADNFDLSAISISGLLQLFLLAHRYVLPETCYSENPCSFQVVLEHPLLQGAGNGGSNPPHNRDHPHRRECS